MKKLRSLVLVSTLLAGARHAFRQRQQREPSPNGAQAPPENPPGSVERPGPVARRSPPPAPAEEPKGIKARLARLPVLGPALRIQDRFSELHGNELAAVITLQAFLALFPLALVALAVVGFVSAGADNDVAGRITGQLGLTGQAGAAVGDAIAAAERSRKAASVVGFVGLLWSGLGLVGALQFGYNQVWQVKERGLKDKAVGIVWLVGAALLFVATAAVTTALRWLPGVLAPVGMVVALLVNFGLWLWTAKLLPNRKVSWRVVVPGAVVGALGVEALKLLGAYYVPRAVASSSQLYGSLGVVFAILVWLLFFGRLIIYSAVVDVMAYEKRYGTVTATIEAPRLPDRDQEEANRLARVE